MPFTSACKHFGRRRGIFFQNTRKKASVVSIQRELLLLIKSSSIHNNKQVLVTPCHLRNKIVKQIVAWWKSIVQHLCVCEEHSRMLDIYRCVWHKCVPNGELSSSTLQTWHTLLKHWNTLELVLSQKTKYVSNNCALPTFFNASL